MNCSTTKVSTPATTPTVPTSVTTTASERGTPCRSIQSTTGDNSADASNAIATGTITVDSFCTTSAMKITAAAITSSRQDHSAAIRTRGWTASAALEAGVRAGGGGLDSSPLTRASLAVPTGEAGYPRDR